MPVNISQRDKVLQDIKWWTLNRLSELRKTKTETKTEATIKMARIAEIETSLAHLDEELRKPLEINKETVH